ncbi:hypothetical protein QQF64_034968 [Cirrhinus molitorella]|uniref:Uncharacterized protein n=1 Tax=Cirrhinus molitorella TaxID=172907 RepID=A0ABR3NEE4_9TELE
MGCFSNLQLPPDDANAPLYCRSTITPRVSALTAVINIQTSPVEYILLHNPKTPRRRESLPYPRADGRGLCLFAGETGPAQVS